ncbi:Serine/threonine protein kinase [uncultured Candidatus Thioglobus sp.]|nr:Serine/threonine protein kinase [uncultured Candidatus Thioglobus sp.]
MADFQKALEALAKGDLDIDVLAAQLTKILDSAPQQANRILTQLDEAYFKQAISNENYKELKSKINQYRQSHGLGDNADPDATQVSAEDIDATQVSEEEPDATQVSEEEPDVTQVSAEDPDATQVSAEDPDATQVSAEDPDATEVSTAGTTDFDVMGQSNSSTFDITGAADISDLSSAENVGMSPNTQEVTTNLGPGSIIKHRFKLMNVLGIGGMGKVYKGLDLLKEEAKDKRPHVAIKLLNEDFKDHPEAFISLQRESSRQQKLAHPNIATIYDFDRVGGPGTPVYITMELMEGMELKDYIKKKIKPQGGLSFDEAFKIIAQLVSGLAYAHARRLVHSDFKPGNCFMCDDGTVKTLDFGIARAVKNPITGETEKTLFDPGQLGALTPAYASYEMLEGEEPDTRDDIYALGCVAYELLSGAHPFGKVPANKAKANNLKPPIIKGLKKKQNRALQRAIAFKRENRSPTVEHFIEELEARYVWYKSPLTIAAILFVAITLGGTVPLLNYSHQKKIDQFVADINTGTPQIIADRLASIGELKKTDQRVITEEAKTAVHSYFSNQITRLIDITTDNYNFLKAQSLLTKISVFYPESSFFEEQEKLISTSKKHQLSNLYSQFSDSLTAITEQNDATSLDQIKSILHLIRTRIDPKDSLLNDPRTSNQYRLLANNAYDLGQYEKALQLITSGITLIPEDTQLSDIKTKIETAINIEKLEEKIFQKRSQLISLEDYQGVKGDIIELAKLDRENAVFSGIVSSLQEISQKKLKEILDSGTQADAVTFTNKYGELLSALQLNKELLDAKLAYLSETERAQTIKQLATTNIEKIQESLQAPSIDDLVWEGRMLASIQELASLVENTKEATIFNDKLRMFRDSIVALYIDSAQIVLDKQRFDAAKTFISRGAHFTTQDNLNLEKMSAEIEVAEVAHEKKLLVDGLMQDFRTQVLANQINNALQCYNQIKIELPEDDVFISQEAPILLAGSYAELARNSFLAKDFINALQFADKGLEFNPDDPVLKVARTEYLVESNIIDLTEQFSKATSLDISSVQRKIGEISNSVKFSEFRQNAIQQLVDRINSLRDSNENVAAKLAQDATILFPGSALDALGNTLVLTPWPNASLATATLNSGKLTESQALLQTANAEFQDHPDVLAFAKVLETNIEKATTNFKAYMIAKDVAGTDYAQLRNTKKLLVRAQAMWLDNPTYDIEAVELEKLINTNKPVQKQVITREVVNLDTEATGSSAVQKEWAPTDSGRACNETLAGYGKRAKAICYDFINTGWRGPLMVVIPVDSSFEKNFAISKYEISVGDYGKYCVISKSCAPEKNKEKFGNPLTGISISQANAYAQWVTERTGKTYRLPTKNEWIYAANANGQQPRKDYNCRVALGDKIVKGTGITSVKSGASNGWGLKNYIGNVQEWVVDETNITAIGGSFLDPHSKCSISLERKHNGQTDDATGFRLILEDT